MKDFKNSWTGILIGVLGSAVAGHYFGFFGWLFFFVVLITVFKHFDNAGQA